MVHNRSTLVLELGPLNTRLRDRGIRLQVEQRRLALVARGTLPETDGTRKRRRVSLDLPAVEASLNQAELRCIALHEAVQAGTFPQTLPWSTSVHAPIPTDTRFLSCEEAVTTFTQHYWDSRQRTQASERTWDRISLELRRLPKTAPCTLERLTQTIRERTTPGTRTRLECCKVYKRLARHLGLPGNLERISDLQGHYEPEARTVPDDTTIVALLDALISTKWGWCYAAIATFGCRPAEVPSLVIHEDGTAQCLTIKRRNRAPSLRTCFALPRGWIDRYDLGTIRIPGETRWTQPDQYASAEGKRFVDAWRHGRRTKELRPIFEELLPEFDLYDLRHRWAIRSIEAGKPLTLCARAMGHSASVHEQTYHRYIQAEDLRRAMAAESN